MNLAQQIAAASRVEVEAPEGSGLWWRVQQVHSGDLLKAKFAGLRMVEAAAKVEDETEAAKRVLQSSDRSLDQVANATAAVVCAGVTHVRQGLEGEWQTIKIVLDEKSRDPDHSVLHITDVAGPVQAALYKAISDAHGDAKGAAERLAIFRRAG